jgi:hypothetical protein
MGLSPFFNLFRLGAGLLCSQYVGLRLEPVVQGEAVNLTALLVATLSEQSKPLTQGCLWLSLTDSMTHQHADTFMTFLAVHSKLSQERHHRAPVGESGLEQIQPDEGSEKIPVGTQPMPECQRYEDENPGDQPKRTF